MHEFTLSINNTLVYRLDPFLNNQFGFRIFNEYFDLFVALEFYLEKPDTNIVYALV